MKPKDLAMYILGALLTICFFLVLAFLIFKPMPQENKDVLYLAIGALIGFMGTVVTYFYGSSAGSAEKTDIMAKQKVDENATEVKIAEIKQ
jgi:drug/metabolite transporter (DMT)-like permease